MFRVATLVVFVGCINRVVPGFPPAIVQPESLAAAIVLAWLLCGPQFGLAVATVAWSLLNVGWTLEERLAPALAGQDIVVVGTVCDIPRDDGRARRFLFRIAGTDAPPGLPRVVYLSSYDTLGRDPDGALAGGQGWRLKVRLKRPRGLANPGAFDFERWALERRIGATGYVRRSAINGRVDEPFGACPTTALRQDLARRIVAAAGATGRARFLPALAVGARNRLTQSDWTLLRRTGTAHLVAISGLHIGLVAALMLGVGRLLATFMLRAGMSCGPAVVARSFALAGAGAYAAMAGFSVPTTRAFVMVATVIGLASCRRVENAWRILGAAVIAVAWVDPLATFGTGFWLSFGAVTVLLLAAIRVPDRPAAGHGRRIANLKLLARAQLTLCIGLAPLTAMFFSEVSLVAPVVNFLFVPVFATLVVPPTLLGTLCLYAAPPAAELLLGFASLVVDASLSVLSSVASWNGAAWRPVMTPPVAPWLAGLAVLSIVWPRPLRIRIPAAVALLCMLWLLASRAAPALRVVVMDAGQGLAVLVQTSDHALLYDAGPRFGDRDAGQSVVLPVLDYYGITNLDAIVVSHADNDHAGGVKSVLAAYPNAKLIAAESLGLAARTMGRCRVGVGWEWNQVRFRILHPDGDGRWRTDNDRSCVLSIESGDASLLLPGDVERMAETHLAGRGLVGGHDLVVAPHHGSATSSSPLFVRAVAPRFVVFATGYGNRWGFPNPDVERRWRESGACLLDTGPAGAIVFEATAGEGLTLVSRHRSKRRHVWTEGALTGDACAPGTPVN